MRKVVFEVILILLISLVLSLTYNAVSPAGIRILPKKVKNVEIKSAVHIQIIAMKGHN